MILVPTVPITDKTIGTAECPIPRRAPGIRSIIPHKKYKIVVIDNKSSEYPFRLDGKVKAKSKQSFENYKKQMYLYSYAVMEKYGEFPKEITWNHFKDGGKFATIPFIKAEYDEAVKWFVDTIHNIEKEQNFEPNEDFFYCHNLCNFRHSCEYVKTGGI